VTVRGGREAGASIASKRVLPQPTRGHPYLVLAFAGLCWSGNHIVGRALAGHLPPMTISTIRWLLPLIILYAVARPTIRRDWPHIRQHWAIMLWLGLTGGLLFSALQYVGLQYTTALNTSILNSLVPVLIIAAGALIFRDRVHLGHVLGISVSLGGVLVIITRAELAVLLQLSFNYGDIIIFVNMAIFAVYAVCLRLQPSIHWSSLLVVLAVVSSVGTLPFAVLEATSGQTFDLTPSTVAAALYVSIFPGLLAFAAWNRGVELIGAGRAGPFLHLVPLFTAVLGTLFLGERLMLFHVAGLVLILGGVWLATRPASGPR